MKNKLYIYTILFSLLIFFTHNQTIAQTGFNCVCGAPMNAPLSQHASNCPLRNTPKPEPPPKPHPQPNQKPQQKPSGSSAPKGPTMEQYVAQQVISNLLNYMLKSSQQSTQQTEQQKAEQLRQQQLEQQRLAAQMAALKRYKDSVAQAQHDKMMQKYKHLDTNSVEYKSINQKFAYGVKYSCIISDYSGKVMIVRNNGKITELSKTGNHTLMVGDYVYVPEGSNLKMHYQFEEGGKDVIFGQNTLVNIMSDEGGSMFPSLVDGKISLSTKTQVKLNGKEYKVNNIVDEQKAYAEEEYLQLRAEYFKLKYKFAKAHQVRTPTAICGVRGTSYIITQDSILGSVIKVYSGKVSVTGIITNDTIVVEKGFKIVVNNEGEMIGPTALTEEEWLMDPDKK